MIRVLGWVRLRVRGVGECEDWAQEVDTWGEMSPGHQARSPREEGDQGLTAATSFSSA